MTDGLLQPRIGGLFHGVSRQAPLQRSPNQMQDLDNFLPSVDIGGCVDRTGTTTVSALPKASYATGAHHFFRTTDGQRWVLLKKSEYGGVEVRNVDTGALASLNYGPGAQSYVGNGSGLKFLTLSDTTFILNPSQVVQASVSSVPPLTSVYVVIRKLSSGAQTFTVTSSVGIAQWALLQGQGSIVTLDFIAMALMNTIAANMPGISVVPVASNVLKMSGPSNIMQTVTATNNWDESAMLCIKGRVTALSDLPGTFESNVPILVDLGFSDKKTSYYVSYDAGVNAWVESSYLSNKAPSADLNEGTMPMRLRQLGPLSFELQPFDWVARKTGDNDSNPLPQFVGKRITSIAHWKGRLWLSADSALTGSQADDLGNFFRDSAREVRPADPLELTVDSPDLGVVQHMVAFRNKLMVMSDTAQLEVPGDKPVTPEDATIGVATRYQLDRECTPTVIGDSLYYTGTSAGRSALWEYNYDQVTENNTAFELSKHIPGYVPGKVRRIRGSAQSARSFLWTPSDPSRLYVHTGYFKDGQRAQNAWSKLTFPDATAILDHWVNDASLFVLLTSAGFLWIMSVPVDVSLGDNIDTDVRLDFKVPVSITWNITRNRSEVMLPAGYTDLGSLVLLTNSGDGWFREHSLTKVWDGTQWLVHFPAQVEQETGYLGRRFERSVTFSPFYPTLGESVTPEGRLQVRTVVVDALVSCDFTATVTRPDRAPMVAHKSPRLIGEALVPVRGYNLQHRIPFNSKGDQAELKVSTTSTGPLALTGFTLLGRYTNPTAS